MNTITNINELEKYTLALGDSVIFNINNRRIIYEVCCDHLTCKGYSNEVVFFDLGITYEEKYELASKIYGYYTGNGSWPSCREDDFKALTNLVKILYALIDAKNKHDGSTEFNIFEIIQKYILKDTSEKLSDLKSSKIKIKHIVKDKESQLKRIK